MSAQAHPLEPFFHQAVRNAYQGKLGLYDPDATAYVARMLCRFSDTEKLYLRDETGAPIEELDKMVRISDPIHGIAPSFDAERALRKHIGDYSLFVGGMYPEAADSICDRSHHRRHQPTLEELIKAGKESYFIVSQFNLFEYEQEAPLFTRLSDGFERYLLGLKLVRDEFAAKPKLLPPSVNGGPTG